MVVKKHPLKRGNWALVFEQMGFAEHRAHIVKRLLRWERGGPDKNFSTERRFVQRARNEVEWDVR